MYPLHISSDTIKSKSKQINQLQFFITALVDNGIDLTVKGQHTPEQCLNLINLTLRFLVSCYIHVLANSRTPL